MKFEEYLVPTSREHLKRHDLEKEVVKLKAELEEEEALSKVLSNALSGPACVPSMPWLSPEVQVLVVELAMVEQEITLLERKVKELKMRLYQEKEQNKEREIQQQQQQQQQKWRKSLHNGYGTGPMIDEQRCRSHNYEENRNGKRGLRSNRRPSLGSALDIEGLFNSNDYEISRRSTGKVVKQCSVNSRVGMEKPNKISEDLIKCLIGIFLELNKASSGREVSAHMPKLTLSCMKSAGIVAKSSFKFKTPSFILSDSSLSNLDPYGILSELDSPVRDIGPYKDFVHITRSSLDVAQFSHWLPAFGKLRVLIHRLCNVDLTFSTYKQKLAFWINIYNACIMNAFLEHGLPSTHDKLLSLMNKAAMNVGGIVLNALAIEHFILRHPYESQGVMDEKEMLLRHAYGLGYPEPNVTFALCRGSWSSPALRVYTPDEVMNELERAKVEYLEAAVGATSKRKIVVPKVLQWYMRDFADDMESLLEWIYSQLASSGSLKRLMIECLIRDIKSPISKMVEIQPYDSQFRYLLPL